MNFFHARFFIAPRAFFRDAVYALLALFFFLIVVPCAAPFLSIL
jgi:hypothetical protein